MRILASGPMCSLRHALMLWLVPLFLLVGAASAAFTYWSYGHMVGSFMDEQMQQLADVIASNEEPTALRQQDGDSVDKWGHFIAQVWNAEGRLEATTWPMAAPVQVPGPGFHDAMVDGKRWRVYAGEPTASGYRVQVLQSSEFRRKMAAGRAGAALAPVLILLPLAIVILWAVAGKLSREVQDIGHQAARQDENSITELPLDRVPEEIVPLVESFNSLLTRLRAAFTAQRRFVQDAAHELRTPIAALGLQLENVRHELPPGCRTQSFAQLESGVARAQRLVDQLLKLSQQESAAAPDPAVQVDLQAQVRESIGGLIAMADRRQIDLGCIAEPCAAGAHLLRCRAGDIRCVLDNLIENALRYTPPGGVVDVHVASRDGRPLIEVVDTGPGIPPDQLARVFDRFYRVPGSGTVGSGLGLSIAQGAAQRCGLRIVLRNREDRSGLVARVEPA